MGVKKNFKKLLPKIYKLIFKLFILSLITSWLFVSWPPTWQNLRFPSKLQEVQAAVSDSAMIVYALGTNTTPRYRLWDEATNTWGAEGSATAVSGTIQFMVLRFARTRNEAILGTLDSTGDIRTQVWNGSTWSATTLHANVGTTNDVYRGFDIAYETNGDRAIIVFNDANSADPAYQIWDGTSWSSKTSITDPPTTGAPLWIELASKPLSTSSEIAMMLIDANVDVYGMVWTGSSWSNMDVSAVWDDTGASATKKSIDVAYEQNSGRAMFIWGDSVATDQYYRIWDGKSLGTITLLDIAASGGVCEWVRLVPRPNSNELMYGCQDAGADLNTRKWSGSAWDTATQHPEHDATVEQITTRVFDIVWETYPANAGKAWLVWGDGATHSRKQWSGTAWGTVTTAGDDTAIIRLEAQPNSGTVFSLIYQDSSSLNDDILEEHLVDGGTTWSALFTVWAGPVPEVTYEPFDIATKRYEPVTYQQSAYRFFANLDSTDVGSPLAAQDTAATLSSSGQAFRLRLLLHIDGANLIKNGENFKLQFSQQGADNLCDTAFSGETYNDVTTTTVIAFNDNPTPTDDSALTANANDPIHGADTIVNQTYEELNNFTNSQAAINVSQDGKWDFSLKDNGASANTAYCFRVVKADGTLLNTYTVIPKITTAGAISCNFSTTSTSFASLDPSVVVTSSPDITITITSSGDFQITVKDAGNSTNSGLYKSTAPTYLIQSTDATLSAGTDGYGIQATTTNTTITINPKYNKSGNDVGGLSLTDVVLARSSQGAVSNAPVNIKHKASASYLAPVGSYSDTLTYSCSAI